MISSLFHLYKITTMPTSGIDQNNDIFGKFFVREIKSSKMTIDL